MGEQFAVLMFFKDGKRRYVRRFVSAQEASRAFAHCISSIEARFGIGMRVVITDRCDCILREWQFGKGITFPPKNFPKGRRLAAPGYEEGRPPSARQKTLEAATQALARSARTSPSEVAAPSRGKGLCAKRAKAQSHLCGLLRPLVRSFLLSGDPGPMHWANASHMFLIGTPGLSGDGEAPARKLASDTGDRSVFQ